MPWELIEAYRAVIDCDWCDFSDFYQKLWYAIRVEARHVAAFHDKSLDQMAVDGFLEIIEEQNLSRIAARLEAILTNEFLTRSGFLVHA